jgi:hypothetical protein
MGGLRHRLPVKLRHELEGLDWCLENGGKHLHLRVGDRLVGVLPKGNVSDSSRVHKMLAAVRRFKKARRA